MYMGLDVFEAADRERARALADFYQHASETDLYLTYVIINPQGELLVRELPRRIGGLRRALWITALKAL